MLSNTHVTFLSSSCIAPETQRECGKCCAAGGDTELERLRFQLRHVEGELAAARGAAAGVDVNLAHVDDVIALKTQVANLMAELESERHAAREVGAHLFQIQSTILLFAFHLK